MASFKVEDMSCGHCVSAIGEAVKALDPDADVKADLQSKIVDVTSSTDPATIQRALSEIGYPAEAIAA